MSPINLFRAMSVRGLSLEDRHEMLRRALQRHRAGMRGAEVEAELQRDGASAEEARAICDQARRQFEDQVVQQVTLPRTARGAVNYYFALGLTPRASTDEVRSAYRRRAREVHPDRHAQELESGRWQELMKVVRDAHQVLTDPSSRMAYDVAWLRRSHQVTQRHCTRAERRGDWPTRLLWYLAEVTEVEQQLEALLASGAGQESEWETLCRRVDHYEDRVLSTRLQTHTVPQPFTRMAEQVRQELSRKHSGIERLRRVVAGAPGDLSGPTVEELTGTLNSYRAAQTRFELAMLQETMFEESTSR
jgi:hypothetical protein